VTWATSVLQDPCNYVHGLRGEDLAWLTGAWCHVTSCHVAMSQN